MAGEAQQATAVFERDDDLAGGAFDTADFAPRHAHVERSAELQPSTREDEMAVLIRTAPPEADGRDVVATVAWRERVWRLHRREVALFETVGEFTLKGVEVVSD